jgi:sortase family protein
MDRIRSFLDRLLPALIAAGGVALLAAGLMTVLDPAAAQAELEASPSLAVATSTPAASPSPSQGPSPSVETSPSPSGSPAPAIASRVVVPAMKIDLPIVAQSFGPGKGTYPLCDVAQYLEVFGQPSEPGTTYLYAHAREGMFLPLLRASERNNGRSMIGDLVQVYTTDGTLYLYEIFRVKRHSRDFSLADDVPLGEQRLILQTSEGPKGTIPKLQIAARLVSIGTATLDEANPKAKPRDCR